MEIILEIDGEPTLSQDEQGGNPRCRANVVCSGFGVRGSYEGEYVCQDNRIILSGEGKCEFAEDSFLVGSYEGGFRNNQFNGWGRRIFPEGDFYEGNFENNQFNGLGKYVPVKGDSREGYFSNNRLECTGKYVPPGDNACGRTYGNSEFNGWGKFVFENKDCYEGYFRNGDFNGWGKLVFASNNNYYVGNFKNGNYEGQGKFVFSSGGQHWGPWKRGKRDGIIKCLAKTGEFHEVFCHEGREESISCMSAGFYGKDGGRAEVGTGGKRRILWKIKLNNDSGGAIPSLYTDYYIYGTGGELEKTIRVNYNRLNALANEEIASFDELIAREAIIDVTEGLAESEKIRTFGAAKGYLRRAVLQDMEHTRQLFGKLLDGRGGEEIIGLLQLMNLDTPEQFKFIRFIDPGWNMVRPEYVYNNGLETFLGALGINAANLGDIRTNFITLSLAITDLRHSAGLIVNVKKIKELVIQQHRQLSDIKENVMLCFDSSRGIDYPGNEMKPGGITRYCRFMNQNLQKHNVCWLYTAVATLVAARDPALVERLLVGEILSYGPRENREQSKLPNEFVISVLQRLQEVAAGVEMALVDGRLFSRLVVMDKVVSSLNMFLNDQLLIGNLEYEIGAALERTGRKRGIEFRDEFEIGIRKCYLDELSREIQPLNLETRKIAGPREAIEDKDIEYILILKRTKILWELDARMNECLMKVPSRTLASPASSGEQIIIWESVDRPDKKYPTRTKNNPSQSAAGPGQGSVGPEALVIEDTIRAMDDMFEKNPSSIPGKL
ncbi:MAG: hypothetical protein LBU15_00475 [Rickettsiales bacterium]|nr:hypothetical protein [Rickettsiales bacterium]